METCSLCPFQCGVDRDKRPGVCRLPNRILVSHVQPHFFEEPFISGESQTRAGGGSGTLFFTGCNGCCVFCQNYKVSQPEFWIGSNYREVDDSQLLNICLELVERKKVHNINFVSPTPYSGLLTSFLKKHKTDIPVPIVWNSNGYEKTETLRRLEGLVDVYLPDLKYFEDGLAIRYSGMPHYFQWASEAIREMFRQVGHPQLNSLGFIQKGLVIRHLVLPGQAEDSKRVLSWVRETFGPQAFVSLMGQYTPTYRSDRFPEIHRKLRAEEYQALVDYFMSLGFEDGLIQNLDSADGKFIPPLGNDQ